MAESPSEGEVDLTAPPSELRCKRTDGKTWRCRGWRIHEQPWCEKHYLKIIEKNAKKKPFAPPRNFRVGKKRSEDAKSSGGAGGSGKGGGFVVNKGKKLGLFSGGKRDKRSGGREGEASSSEEVLPKKKPRSKRMSVEDKEEEDSEETEEDERVNVMKSGKRSGEKGKKFERYGGSDEEEVGGRRNVVISAKKGGKPESLVKKKKVERKEGSDEEGGILRKEERGGNVVKRAKRSGKFLLDEKKKKKKILRDGGSEEEGDSVVKYSEKGGEIELGRKNKKQIERNEESEEDDYWVRELNCAKKSGGVKLGKEKTKVVRNCQSDEEEKRRHYVVKSGQRSEMGDGEEGERDNVEKFDKSYRKPELGRKKKKVECNKETEDEERSRELIIAKSSNGVKWGEKKRKVERNNQIVDEKGRDSTVKGGQRSHQVELRMKKTNDLRAMTDEGEREKANVEKGVKKGGRLDMERKKEKLGRDKGSADEDEERSVVKSDERIDLLVTATKRQKSERNTESDDEDNERDDAEKIVERSDEMGSGKTRQKFLRTGVCDEEEEEDGGSLKENNAVNLLKMLKAKGLRTKTVEVGMKGMLNEEENFANGDTNDTTQDGEGDGGKKKSQLRGNTKELGKVKAEGDSEDGDDVDGNEEMDDVCLIKFAKKDFKPEAFSKREDKKLRQKKGSLLNMFKGEKDERFGEEDTIDDENVDSVFKAKKKAKRTFKTDSQTGERRRKGSKLEILGETKEEDDDRTESDDGAYLFRERSSRTKKSRNPKVDLRRKHFSTDVSFSEPSF